MATSKASSGNGAAPKGPKIHWDTSQMSNSYANVCNVSSTREEVVLLFGINQAFTNTQEQLTIQLNDRIILSPFAAKRLHDLLGKAIDEYESAFGKLPEGGQAKQ